MKTGMKDILKLESKINYLLKGRIMSDAEADALDALAKPEIDALLAKGFRRHHVSSCAVRLSGPLIPVIIDPERYSKHHSLGKRSQ